MKGKGYSDGYQKQVSKYLNESFVTEIHDKRQLSELILGHRTQFIRTAAMDYLNYLEESEILATEDADYFRKTIPSRQTTQDGYIPSDAKVRAIYSKITNVKMKRAFEILACSGVRVRELTMMLRECDKDKLQLN